jgi:hypothetical protein
MTGEKFISCMKPGDIARGPLDTGQNPDMVANLTGRKALQSGGTRPLTWRRFLPVRYYDWIAYFGRTPKKPAIIDLASERRLACRATPPARSQADLAPAIRFPKATDTNHAAL